MLVEVLAGYGARQHGMKPEDREVRILNRLVTLKVAREERPESIEWEADPRHVEILSTEVGLTAATKTGLSWC